MILEQVKKGHYRITKDGVEIGILKARYYHRKTGESIPLESILNDRIDKDYIWSNGYALKWSNGNEEYFTNVANVGEKYVFDNYPGPRNVLRRTNRHKHMNG